VKLAINNPKIFTRLIHYPDKMTHNLVPNCSFEYDINLDATPDYWHPFGTKGTGYWGGSPAIRRQDRGINLRTDEDSFSGRYSAKMTGLAEGVGGQIIASCYGLQPGEFYEFDAAVKSSTPHISFSIKFFDYQKQLIKRKNKNIELYLPKEKIGQWTMLSDIASEQLDFTIPHDCRKMNIYLLVKNKQTVFWDDIYVVKHIFKDDKLKNKR
jgi:hypothetical protein